MTTTTVTTITTTAMTTATTITTTMTTATTITTTTTTATTIATTTTTAEQVHLMVQVFRRVSFLLSMPVYRNSSHNSTSSSTAPHPTWRSSSGANGSWR